MLALSRKVGESIVINDNITVTILAIAKDQIKIGIDAPREVSIHRKEIFLQIQDENKQAATTSVDQMAGLKDLMK